MDGRKGGKRYSTERQERLKNVKNLGSATPVTSKPDQKSEIKVYTVMYRHCGLLLTAGYTLDKLFKTENIYLNNSL